MIWFFAFTAMGAFLTLLLLMLRQAFRPGWKMWLTGTAAFFLLGWLADKV